MFFSKWRLYKVTAKKPLNLRCSAAGNTTKVILAVKKNVFIMNKSNKIPIKFLKYWIHLCKFKVKVRIFHKRNGQKLVISRTIFTISKKSVRILRDNLIENKCAKFQVDRIKIVCSMLSADLKNMVSRKTRHSRHFGRK